MAKIHAEHQLLIVFALHNLRNLKTPQLVAGLAYGNNALTFLHLMSDFTNFTLILSKLSNVVFR